jgi:uncharacterized OB-fold protein
MAEPLLTVPRPRGESVASAGRGAVYSTTVVHRPGEEPYNVCLVDLDEGVRVMGRVTGLAPGEVTIGLRVQAAIDGEGVVVYEPEGSDPSSRAADTWS